MPQVINLGRPPSKLEEALLPVDIWEDKYEELRGYERINFDPSKVFQDTQEPIYSIIFNPIEKAFKDIVGRPIDLSKGDPYVNIYKPAEDIETEKELSKFVSPVQSLMERDLRFNANVYGERRELFARDLGKELYGIKKYIDNHPGLPPDGSPQRDALNKAIDKTFADNWGNMQRMITHAVKDQGLKHAVSESHAGPRALQSAKQIGGQMLKGSTGRTLGGLMDFISQMSGPSEATQSYAKAYFDTGDEWVKESKERLESEELEPTGTYAMSMKDLPLSKGYLSGKYALATVSESAISNVLITGSGILAGVLSPGKKLKIAAGAIGSMIPGYAVESASAEAEALEELSYLRSQAAADKKSLSPEEFKEKYTYWLSDSHSITADELSDENISAIAQRIGQYYGVISAGVEGLSTGVEFAVGLKWLRSAQGMKQISKSAAKGRLGRTIMRSKDVAKFLAKGFGLEAGEEAIQESVNQEIMKRNVPFYEFDSAAVWKSAYAGGLFGAAMATATTGVGGYLRKRREAGLLSGAHAELSKMKEARKEGEDITPYDKKIKGGLFLKLISSRFVDDIATADNKDNFLETSTLLDIRAGQIASEQNDWYNAKELTKILSDPEVRDFYKIREMDLMMHPNFFSDEQVAEILGVEVNDLEYDHGAKIPRGKSRKKKVPGKKVPYDITKKRRKGKRILPDMDRTAADESFELRDLKRELTEIIEALGELEAAPVDETDSDRRTRLGRIKELGGHKKKIRAMIKKVQKSSIPNRKTKDPLAQRKQRLITRANNLGDESFTDEELTKIKSIPGKKVTAGQLNKIEEFIKKAENKPQEEQLKAAEEKEESKVALNTLRDNLISIEKEIEDYTGDKRKKEYKELVKNQKGLETRLGEAEEAQYDPITDESLRTTAENVYNNILDLPGVKITYNKTQLMNMNDAKLLEIAKEEKIDSTDRNEIIAKYLDMMGIVDDQDITMMHMGLPISDLWLNKFTKKKAEAWFRESWNRSKERHGIDDFSFDSWADAMSKRMPDNLRKHWDAWSNKYSPNESWLKSAEGRIITGIFGPTSSYMPDNMESVVTAADEESEFIKETNAAVDDEDGDLSAKSENILNTKAFAPFRIDIDTEMFNGFVQVINEGTVGSFDEFLALISDAKYGLRDEQGRSPVILADESPVRRAELLQFFTSKLPENFVPVNRGQKTDGRKNIEILYEGKRSRFIGKVTYKNTDRQWISTAWSRAMVGENLIEGLNKDIVWLDKSDVKQRRGDDFRWAQRPGFLTPEEIASLTKTHFLKAGLIPLMMRNDSGRLVLAIVKDTHTDSALKYLTYWKDEVKNGKVSQELADLYSGNKLTSKEMKQLYGNPHKYRAGQIARHETLKKIFGDSYHELSMQDIMLRNSVIFSTAMTNQNGEESSVYVFDYKKDSHGDVKFVTEFEDGSKEEIDAIQYIDGEWQYIGDGTTWTSERVFTEKYPDEVGAFPTARRAKTVKMGHDQSGVLLMKHQEMSFSLPAGAKMTSIVDGKEKIAEIRRDPDGINIYVKGKTGNFDQYVDHLASRDEVKVMTGAFDKMNEVIPLPSGSTGHIQYTTKDKDQANFPMQVLNYIQDLELLDYVSQVYSERSESPRSPNKILARMLNALRFGNVMNSFIKHSRKRYSGSIPRMIENFADVGSGLHPAGLNLAMNMLKNRAFKRAQDFLQRGGVLDFRASVTENLADDEMIASADHSMRFHIITELSDRTGISRDKLKKMSTSELNTVLKKNPVEVMMVRFPVPSQSGFRIMRITKLESGLGDSFKVNPKVVKEVFEGDHDYDTGHVSILDKKMLRLLKRNQVATAGINIKKYQQLEDQGTIANLTGATNTMSALVQGKMAIGQIASIQRNYGVLSHYLNNLVIDGKKIFLRSLDAPVVDPDMILEDTGKPEKQSLGMMFRTYAQAAFDNPKLRLLTKWKYSSEKLVGMMFHTEDGSALTEKQINTLEVFLSEHNKTSQIRNGRSGNKKFTLKELFDLSMDYKNMVENRSVHVVDSVSDRIDSFEAVDKDYGALTSIDVKEGKIHPLESRAIEPALMLERFGLDINKLTDNQNMTSAISHAKATAEILEGDYRAKMTAESKGLTLEQFQNLSPDEFNIIQKDVQSGIDWGRSAHSQLLKLYAKTYDANQEQEEAKPIDPNSWDHNEDFNNFYMKLYHEGLGGLTAYSKLSKTQQVAATFAFLDRFITDTGVHADYAGKILPVSKEGVTLLDPEIMGQYFEYYNRAAESFVAGEELPGLETIRASKIHETQVNELRRIYGCE